jgi:DNA primase
VFDQFLAGTGLADVFKGNCPATWGEVAACRKPDDPFFTAPDVLARVADHGDLFAKLLPGRA